MPEPIKLQERIELTTPHEHKVVIRGYATGRIRQAISAAYSKTMTVEFTGERDDKGQPVTHTTSTGLGGQEATNEAIRGMVLSVDGVTDNVLDLVLDLPEDDYDYIKGEVDKAGAPLAKNTGSNSKTPTTTSSTKE